MRFYYVTKVNICESNKHIMSHRCECKVSEKSLLYF